MSMDQPALDREIRRLRRINAVSLCALAIAMVAAFAGPRHAHFDVLDVGRLNIVEPTGVIRLAISNKAQFPDPVVDGKAYPLRSGARPAGLIFFNDLGDEDGGLIWSGKRVGNTYEAGASLTMDQWRQDEAVVLSYEGGPTATQWAGFRVIDRPDKPFGPLLNEMMKARKLAEGPQRDSAMSAIRKLAADSGLTPATRIVIGRGSEKAATVQLNDAAGHTRILLSVDSLGTPTMQFLDAAGKVVYELPTRGH